MPKYARRKRSFRKRRSNRRVSRYYKVARKAAIRVVNSNLEWKKIEWYVPTSYISNIGLAVNLQQLLLVNYINQGTNSYGPMTVTSTLGTNGFYVRIGQEIMMKAINLNIGMDLNTQAASIDFSYSIGVRIIVWKPKMHMDLDDAAGAMQSTAISNFPTGNPARLNTIFADFNNVTVIKDKSYIFKEELKKNAYFNCKIKVPYRAGKLTFQTGAITPRNANWFVSIYCNSSVPNSGYGESLGYQFPIDQ